MSRPRFLVCPPDFYGIEYEINPWMRRSRQSDPARSRAQWEGLARVLAAAGARLDRIRPARGLPDIVFTANAGVVKGRLFVPSRFRHPERRGEEPHFARWFRRHGFRVASLPEALFFEGAGDALFLGGDLWCGYFFRTDIRSLERVGEILGVRAIPLQLADPRFYHLDTCFCPLPGGRLLWYPPAFDSYARRAIEARIPERFACPSPEALRFACNAVVAGNAVVLNTGCPRTRGALGRWGLRTMETPLDEFLKAGGSAKCLTLRLDPGAWEA